MCGVQSGIGWPTKASPIKYAGREFILRPESKEFYADIITRFETGESVTKIEEEVFRFCSVLAWVEDSYVRLISVENSAESDPARIDRRPPALSGNFPGFQELATDSKLDLMLALYREALTVNSPLFSFFGFFKVLNTRLTGDDQPEWINNNASRLTVDAAISRLMELNTLGIDVGKHIYNSLRTSVIHAAEDDNVNPDSSAAISQLIKDVPLMKALAELFIDDALNEHCSLCR